MPLISVIMGVYYRQNDLSTLSRAINSILNQTLADFELLICDDGSTSQTLKRLEQFAQNDKRVKLVRPGSTFSLPKKLNACLGEACGTLIARMDDDDFSHPRRFEKQVAYLNLHPEIAFVGCNVELQSGGRRVGCWKFPEYPEVRDFYMTQPFIHPALIFRREALDAVGGYSERKHQILCEDYDLLLRLYEKNCYGCNLQENLFTYSVSGNTKARRKMRHRWNEAVTRFQRFQALGKLPEALPYVAKPIAVGLIPEKLLIRIKQRNMKKV